MSPGRRASLVCLSFLFFSQLCLSQDGDAAYAFLLDAQASARSGYDDLIQDQLGVFNGTEYLEYDNGIKGHPFFLEDYFSEGSIEFDNVMYYKVPLMYDIAEDIVLIEYFDQRGYRKNLVVQNDRISSFEYEGHLFERIGEHNRVGSLRDGFYDVLLDEEISIYVSRKKEIYKKLRDGQISMKFAVEDQFFVFMSGETHKVNGKSSVLKLFADRKSALKKYIKANRLDLRRNFEESLILVTRQYLKEKQRNEVF